VESYAFLSDFVGTVAAAGCRVFIVHARNAWLKGLSPKENREVPPLQVRPRAPAEEGLPRAGDCHQRRNPHRRSRGAAAGRAGRCHDRPRGYHHPWWLARWDALYYGETASPLRREEVEERMVAYMEHEHARRGTPWHSVARHMMGLYNGLPGARRWRQVWSDHRLKGEPPREVMRLAHEEVALRA
jgi:tRNA-dihydrouridine synthase A